MSSSKIPNIFENKFLECKTYPKGFSDELFDEFKTKAVSLSLESKIEDLINGSIVNHTEHQAAWHPKYRKEGPKLHNNLEKLINKLKLTKKVSQINILIVGIGGSYEGPKLLIESLGIQESEINLHYKFLTGSDIKEFIDKTKSLDPSETIFIISSKSFKTEETLQMLNCAKKWLLNAEHFIAITSNKKEAIKYGFIDENIILFDKEIGGRYSIWSPIAEVPLLNETSYKDFITGGYQADIDIMKNKRYFEFVQRLSYADIWYNNFKNINTRAVLSYIWRFRSLPDYFQQLEMESLGKKANSKSNYKKTSQIVFGGYGPKAQHSYFQLFHQGTQKISIDVIASSEDVKSLSYAQALTQSEILSQKTKVQEEQEQINSNTPVNLFLLKKSDSFSLGYLIATWEYRTFISSIMLEINPFDQYGVEVGKKLTRQFLQNN